MEYFGSTGTILEVDLTTGAIRQIPLTESMIRNDIGGVGISSRLLYENVQQGTDPLSPGNAILIGLGPLGGTVAPSSMRAELVSKSPLSGYIGWANSGYIASMLKYAGYDQLLIKGKASSPVYLKITDEHVEIKEADHLWGKDTWDATDMLCRECGEDHEVTCIGPAGERMVKFACPISNKHSAAARTGLGAIMGSKNLKAIVTRGTKGVRVADKKRFKRLAEEALRRFREKHALINEWRTYGFLAGFKDKADIDEYMRLRGGYYACISCPVACNAWVNIPDGEFAGLSYLASAPGTKIATVVGRKTPGLVRYDEIFKLADEINRYGMDYMSFAGMVNLLADLHKQKILSPRDTDGLDVAGNPGDVRKLAAKIAFREGIGDTLAEGMRTFCHRIGEGAEDLDFSIKGIEAGSAVGGRLGGTETWGFSTNLRGAYMERSTSISFRKRSRNSYVRYCGAIGVPGEYIDRVCDGPEGFSLPRLTKWVETYSTIQSCLGLCRRPPVSQVYDVDFMAEILTAATGINYTAADLLKCGERVWTTQKCFNLREGMTKADDRLPARFLPLTLGGFQVNETTQGELLREYYDEWGWDPNTGVPTRKKLVELGLDHLAGDLDTGDILSL
jgi:aldehyde:ferredoxin oxidoreductase